MFTAPLTGPVLNKMALHGLVASRGKRLRGELARGKHQLRVNL